MKTRPLAPRTEEQYQRLMTRAFGDADPAEFEAAPSFVNEWAESERRILRHAIRDRFARRGLDGSKLAATVPERYTVKSLRPKPTKEALDLFEQKAARFPGAKYRPLLMLMLRLGLRSEELLGLTREQVAHGIETGSLIFKRKGGREHELPCANVREALQRLLTLKAALPRRLDMQRTILEEAGGPPDWQVVGQIICNASFASQYNMLNRAVKRCARLAGLDPKLWSPHKLRHGFATRMHDDGAPIRVVQEALGHASLNTTQGYVSVEREDIAKWVR